ncbi:MAG: hypothetical protein AB7F99_07635 [Vicinamibacterales bacterium]
MTSRRVVYEYAGCGIAVEASDSSDSEWLSEFLRPDFEIRRGAHNATVLLNRDAAEFERLRALGPHPSGEWVPVFGLDGRMEMLPIWTAPAAEAAVFHERAGAFLQRIGDQAYRIASLPGQPQARVTTLRALREIASAAVAESRASVLHAAAFAVQDKGFAIAGAKEAGKTTLLLQCLSRLDGRLVSSDRATVRSAGRSVTVRGMPTIVSVRASSLAYLPHLADRFRANRDHHRYTLAESARLAARAADADKWSLTPGQLAKLLGVERAGEVPLAAVLFPRKTNRATGVAATLLAQGEAAARLAGACFDSGSLEGETFFRRDGHNRAPGSSPGDSARDLALKVPCFDVALGTDAYAERQVEELLTTVAGHATALR